ncbi:hypothetical protein GKQ23_12070 [Erwinia sp. E602]|uniref:hypothetical protein n=1 Tax=unclassified Erwinia TaxID=2622719 RepID=UPI0006F4801F|nr:MULTISPECIES: hypothetical protein [unclassified Erwinia]KQN55656.1 hypothetical protein ASF13_09185 [Erwinia sp. Leaf53]QUG75683.1 hypothetical protein GKQ23_12070 [Erwinia sp. E602]
MSKLIGVITGDLFRSTAGLTRGIIYQRVMQQLEQTIVSHPRFDVAEMELFRGDAFQITLNDPSTLPELAAWLRASLMALPEEQDGVRYDARMSLTIFTRNRYSSFKESAFEQAHIVSGRNLETLDKKNMMVFGSDRPALDAPLRALIALLDPLLTMLSRPQAEVLQRAMAEMKVDTTALAAAMGSSRQNVHKLVTRSGCENIIAALLTIGEHIRMES